MNLSWQIYEFELDFCVKHGCSLSPLLLNIYVRGLGEVISNCVYDIKYVVMGKDYSQEWKSHTGSPYADDVCVMASSEEDMGVIMEQVNECAIGHGLKVNEKKSKVVCINGNVGGVGRRLKIVI